MLSNEWVIMIGIVYLSIVVDLSDGRGDLTWEIEEDGTLPDEFLLVERFGEDIRLVRVGADRLDDDLRRLDHLADLEVAPGDVLGGP